MPWILLHGFGKHKIFDTISPLSLHIFFYWFLKILFCAFLCAILTHIIFFVSQNYFNKEYRFIVYPFRDFDTE